MATAPSPYKYMGNVAPVKKLNVPKVVQPKPATGGGWDADSIKKVMDLGAGAPTSGTLGIITPPPPVPERQVITPATEGHWNVPDYAGLLAGDWQPEEAAIQGQKMRGDAENAFQLALRRAFIDFGGDPSKLDDRYRKYIDDATIEAAKNNQFSAMAQNLKNMTRGLANQRAQLAARGMTRSGANTEQTRRALEARQLADYTAGRTFTGGAEEGLAGLATTEQKIAQMISDAKAQAAARIAQQYPQTWVPGTEAVYGPDPTPEPTSFDLPPLPTPEPYSPYKYMGNQAPVVTPKVESAYERALRLRSEALNKRYGLG